MKRILLSGYYGFNNTGDEAILAALIEGLKQNFANPEIVILSAEPGFSTNLHQVQAVNRSDFKAVRRELKQADILISGGGSLLQDVTSLKTIPYYLGIIVLAKLLGTAVYFLAQGVGPVNNSLNQRLIASVLNRVDLITVRDNQSRALLKEWGVQQRIEVTADLVFTLRAEGQGKRILEEEGLEFKEPLLAVSVRPWGDNSYLAEVAEALDRLSREFAILLIPFHEPDDMEVSQLLAQQMRAEVNLIEGSYEPPEILALIDYSDLLLGVRLHSLIFAAAVTTPLVGISYDPKIDNFLGQLGLEPVGDVNSLAANRLYEVVVETWSGADGRLCREQVQRLRDLAELNFALMLKKSGD